MKTLTGLIIKKKGTAKTVTQTVTAVLEALALYLHILYLLNQKLWLEFGEATI